jgi:hypothetical protein
VKGIRRPERRGRGKELEVSSQDRKVGGNTSLPMKLCLTWHCYGKVMWRAFQRKLVFANREKILNFFKENG